MLLDFDVSDRRRRFHRSWPTFVAGLKDLLGCGLAMAYAETKNWVQEFGVAFQTSGSVQLPFFMAKSRYVL